MCYVKSLLMANDVIIQVSKCAPLKTYSDGQHGGMKPRLTGRILESPNQLGVSVGVPVCEHVYVAVCLHTT